MSGHRSACRGAYIFLDATYLPVGPHRPGHLDGPSSWRPGHRVAGREGGYKRTTAGALTGAALSGPAASAVHGQRTPERGQKGPPRLAERVCAWSLHSGREAVTSPNGPGCQ